MFAFFESPQRVHKLSSHLLISGMAMLVIGALLAYGFDAYLSMGWLVLAHLLTILGPTSIKLGYVLRLQAQYRLKASTGMLLS
ncbi:transmembrane sensor/regulator PpyR [Pseudomonas sp. JS3066]|uniref:transmembrane sensor/regulator PpyR n=1 Tax=unclassified Pseudomonas TaxID=196821 RepID=UPI000EA85AC6|nr:MULTISPECIES: transmembrane sensor/regulator PpyR [unclassified Pseudomonas]AYF86539.1 transmembrane sensor/regulator PpyR [Pseudomonas sp. DY-1]MDH4654738.1 transmembrane sensor/regulator PpyR [Pseudomonas sp. BN606]MRK23877.1 transmembrane sensor/regulator PpyR [Pseudomonas sp. JG-B]WVK96007.1 transmembrane sensor/regulator PpyR [Pseudomonas sp. JS3066]